MKLFGHPVHLMLIHFPSALFPMEAACYGISYFTGNLLFANASFFAMAGGVVLGWLAMLAGIMDLLKISSEKPELIKKALVHGAINGTVVMIYILLACMVFKNYPILAPVNGYLLIAKITLIIFMLAGNYLGANLVLKHKVGVDN